MRFPQFVVKRFEHNLKPEEVVMNLNRETALGLFFAFDYATIVLCKTTLKAKNGIPNQ